MRVIPIWQQFLVVIFLTFSFSLMAQKKPEKKYPALLWEITGKGMKKPSYLFGTMHVSSKLVFHLSDSFYQGIKNADVVALELDPQIWQDQLFRFQNLQTNLRYYTQGPPGDYLNERSFQLEKYDDKLKAALSDEPTVINSLLYRTFQTRADFEEDTYLDLYIYQTGKKLGKQATGVENYFQTEQLIMEAAQDMMKDKRKKGPDMDGQSPFEIEKRTQEAYRKGDLDLLDSLEKMLIPSDSYLEKFLYRRNEIQANSIDSILQQHALFVGVGAAHLPGKRGVIEMLRAKGFILRPVIMPDQDALFKDDIDKIRVPVHFTSFTADDSIFTVQAPGKFYRRTDNRMTESWQYADMSNGAYYMVGRVKTHGCFLGQKDEAVLKRIDNLLYENIPGKILQKTPITRSSYKGFDITSKTRRGDIQRYNILVTPLEILIFKMSGNNNYVEGKEADQFFGSINLRNVNPPGWTTFTPPQGGFRINLPRQPSQCKNNSGMDGMSRWEYEAGDSLTGDAFLIWKKTVQNYRFLEEDTADLALMEESFRLSDYVEKTLGRRTGFYKGYPCLDASYQDKDGSFIRIRCLIRGPHYYLLAARSRSRDKSFSPFFDSFAFTPFQYAAFRNYTDTFLNIRVSTPVIPDIDPGMRGVVERTSSEDFLNAVPDYSSYWPRAKTALFHDDSTGESIFVSSESFPKYYFARDTTRFWEEEAGEKKMNESLIILHKQAFSFGDSALRSPALKQAGGLVDGYKYILSDTNSSRRIYSWIFLKNNRIYRIVCLGDSLQQDSDFVHKFFSSLSPLDKQPGPGMETSPFSSKLDLFFKDFYSRDSLTGKKAREAISNVYFGGKGGAARLLRAIRTLPYNEKDYFSVKTRLISELGYINDSAATTEIVSGLKAIYERAGDTSTIQHAVLKALARHKTSPAYDLLKTLLIQDPPIFDNPSDYNYLFQDLGDSLALAKRLFPDLLELAAVDDYKGNIQSLLAGLVDSGYLHAADYEPYFRQLYFDAKIQWKKQEARDEKKLQRRTDDGSDDMAGSDGDNAEGRENQLENYALLLLPFYDRNATVPIFFNKLLQSRDTSLRLSTAVLLLRYHKPVADSIIRILAASDEFRARLLKEFETIGQGGRFPAAFRNQPAIARSLLAAGKGDNELFDIQLEGKTLVQFRGKKGYMYYFRYKTAGDDGWQIGFSGLQPFNGKDVSTGNEFVRLTGKKIKPGIPAREQFDQQLKRFLFSKRRNAASFYLDSEYFNLRTDED